MGFLALRCVAVDISQQGLVGRGREQLQWCCTTLEEFVRLMLTCDAQLADK
jgi:hypothetical protein